MQFEQRDIEVAFRIFLELMQKGRISAGEDGFRRVIRRSVPFIYSRRRWRTAWGTRPCGWRGGAVNGWSGTAFVRDRGGDCAVGAADHKSKGGTSRSLNIAGKHLQELNAEVQHFIDYLYTHLERIGRELETIPKMTTSGWKTPGNKSTVLRFPSGMNTGRAFFQDTDPFVMQRLGEVEQLVLL